LFRQAFQTLFFSFDVNVKQSAPAVVKTANFSAIDIGVNIIRPSSAKLSLLVDSTEQIPAQIEHNDETQVS
jgi:hypothetical protein